MIDIKDISGNVRISIPVNTGAKGYSELMGHDYIVLPFSSATPVPFAIGDYADLRGMFDDALGGKLSKIYKLITAQTPTYNTSTGGYDYELRLDAYYYEWQNKLFKYLPEKHGQEASWSLTAALDVHMGVFLRNLKARGYKYSGVDYEFAIGEGVENKSLALTYSDTKLTDALTMMAEAADCEWWVTDNIIHFGRCEFGDAVKMELNAEAADMARNDSKGTYATRIYAFGGERNIPANYRPADEQTVVSGVVQKRLMLPVGTPYVDAKENMSEAEIIEAVVTFDDIYPRRVGKMGDIRTVDRKLETDGEENATFKAYQYKDSGLTFSKEYIFEGKELQLTFQSGKLNGMTFSVTFNPDGKNPEEQLFEIVANEDYGRLLPDEVLKPEDGDEYVLFGFDIRLVSDQYIPEAEQELLAKAKEYVSKTCIDDGTYTVTLFSDYVYADQMARTYDIGQKASLVNPAFFADARSSRVIGWEMNLDFPYDSPVYTVGESAQYSRIGEMESKVEALTYKGQTYTGGNGSGVYVVRLHDDTAPSDSNVLSALRSLNTLLRKDTADTTRYLTKFLGGLVSDDMRSQEFSEGILGGGFGLWMDGNGQSRMEVDKLLVRMKAEFESLAIRKAEHMGGELVLSPASMKVAKVETVPARKLLFSDGSTVLFSDGTEAETPSVYRCHFLSDDGDTAITNDFKAGDLATCRTWNVKSGIHEGANNRYYWRAVVGTGDDYIDLSSVDCDAASDAPMAGDAVAQLGNKFDADRQSAIMLSTYGDDGPYVKLYRGIDGYSMDGKEFADISRKRIGLKVDEISLKGKDGAYLSISDELESRPTAEDLLNTGINVNGRTVTVTAENFLVRALDGSTLAAFTYKDGKPVLRAGMIDVDTLFAGTINANDATITNFKFANAQSLDGSFSVDGNGTAKIGNFAVTDGTLKAMSEKMFLQLTGQGIRFSSDKLFAGIGSILSSVTGYSDVVAGYFSVTYDSLPFNSGVVMIKTSGGSSSASGIAARQVALRIETDGGDYDYAIDAKGKIKTDGKTGLTGSFAVRDANDVLMYVDFVNGIYVGTRH